MPETVARLVELRDDQPERAHDLCLGVHVLGREAGVDVILAHGDVSRHHAELHITVDGATLRDLDSKNGVMIGGRKVSGATLEDGSRFAFGDLQLSFEHAGARVDRLLARSGELTVRRPRVLRERAEGAATSVPSLVAPGLAALAFTILLAVLLVFG